jgi:hypothetical protein
VRKRHEVASLVIPRHIFTRALNQRVRGSSPWRRTPYDLVILDVFESAQRPFGVICGPRVLDVCSRAVILLKSPGSRPEAGCTASEFVVAVVTCGSGWASRIGQDPDLWSFVSCI